MVFGCTAYLLVFSLAPGLYSQYQNSLAISKHERIIKMPLISFSRGQQNLIKVFTRNNLLINLCSQNMFPLENWLHYEFFLSNSVEPEKGLPSPSALYEIISVIILTLCNRRSIFSLDMYCNPK